MFMEIKKQNVTGAHLLQQRAHLTRALLGVGGGAIFAPLSFFRESSQTDGRIVTKLSGPSCISISRILTKGKNMVAIIGQPEMTE